MEVSIVAVGKMKAGPERELCDRYLDRARKSGKTLGFRGLAVHEIAESRASRAPDRVAAEADAILGRLSESTRILCLDERGELLDSDALAAELGRTAAGGAPITAFVIGGADGLGPKLRERAHRLISFGRVTWPHQIARILLAEQLYRAMTILSGHPYHRA